ncbi:MAG TPA: universal stress protein [Burkholderiales bacterium]|nr:universal stress protein [Burkholderiales bacterium]
MKHILVATDGSTSADRAVDYAAQLAKDSGANLTVVNVIGGYGLPGELFRRFTAAQQVWLDELLETLSADTLRHAQDRVRSVGVGSMRLESRRGDVAETILEIAGETDADAIVVGKRGSGRISGALLGSVSQKLVSLASRVVIVVP